MSGILKLNNGRQKGVNETTPLYRQNCNPKIRNGILSEPTRKRSNAFEVLNIGNDSTKRHKPSSSQMQRGSSNGGHRSSEGYLPTTIPLLKMRPSIVGIRSSEGNLPTITPIRKPLGPSNGEQRSSDGNISTTTPIRKPFVPSNFGHRSSEGNLPTTTPIRKPLESMKMHGPVSRHKKDATNEDVIFTGTNQVEKFMKGLNKENEDNMDDLITREIVVKTYKLLEKFMKESNEKFEMVFGILKGQVKENGTGITNPEIVVPYTHHDLGVKPNNEIVEDLTVKEKIIKKEPDDRDQFENMMDEGLNAINQFDESREEGEISSDDDASNHKDDDLEEGVLY